MAKKCVPSVVTLSLNLGAIRMLSVVDRSGTFRISLALSHFSNFTPSTLFTYLYMHLKVILERNGKVEVQNLQLPIWLSLSHHSKKCKIIPRRSFYFIRIIRGPGLF